MAVVEDDLGDVFEVVHCNLDPDSFHIHCDIAGHIAVDCIAADHNIDHCCSYAGFDRIVFVDPNHNSRFAAHNRTGFHRVHIDHRSLLHIGRVVAAICLPVQAVAHNSAAGVVDTQVVDCMPSPRIHQQP